VDFVGVFENLERALAFDSKDVSGVVEGLEVLQARFTQLMAQGRADYMLLTDGKTEDKAAEAVLEHFRDKERREASTPSSASYRKFTKSSHPIPSCVPSLKTMSGW
jgi:hypothetical protein